MHSGKLNWTRLDWTELNWIVQFSSVEFSSVFRCALNRRRAATSGDGRRRFLTVKNRRRPSTNRRRPSPVVAGRRRFNAQWETELNWTVQLSSVQFSFPLCIGLNVAQCVFVVSAHDRRVNSSLHVECIGLQAYTYDTGQLRVQFNTIFNTISFKIYLLKLHKKGVRLDSAKYSFSNRLAGLWRCDLDLWPTPWKMRCQLYLCVTRKYLHRIWTFCDLSFLSNKPGGDGQMDGWTDRVQSVMQPPTGRAA